MNEGHRDAILSGLKEQNDPCEYNGMKGFWVQGDCVFVQSQTPHEAIASYRTCLASAGIGINHNHFCGSILAAKRRDWIEAIRKDPSCHESLKQAIDKDCP